MESVMCESVQLRRKSLLDQCMNQAVVHLPELADSLHIIPLELAEIFYEHYLSRVSNLRLHELEVFCKAFWNPRQLVLTGVEGLNCKGLAYLSYSPNLVRLDLSCCYWLNNLNFLPEVAQLRCLSLRDCWRLPAETLTNIKQLHSLECLDAENVQALNDDLAAHIFQGMSCLEALNVSGTGVGDGFVEALTYGCRLRSWVSTLEASKAAGNPANARNYSRNVTKTVSNFDSNSFTPLLHQWPHLNVKYLRLQRTFVTQAAIQNLLSLEDIKLLDLRNVDIKRKYLSPVQAKFGLISPPNEYKLLARSNSVIVATLGGLWSCAADPEGGRHQIVDRGEKNDSFLDWEHIGFLCLLQEASR